MVTAAQICEYAKEKKKRSPLNYLLERGELYGMLITLNKAVSKNISVI